MAGFRNLMRYCDTLAEYEKAKADGIVTDDVLVIVLEEKVAKFKGQTFDWSEGGSNITVDSELSDTSENPVQNKVVTEALNGKVNKSYVDEKITDLTNEMIANEEVHAGAYNDLNTRLNELSKNVHGETVTKEEFNAAIEGVNNGISAKQDVLVSGTNIKSINGESILGSGDIKIDVDTSTLATKEELLNLQNEVVANEEVTATALNNLNDRKADKAFVTDAIASAITTTLNTAV